MLEHKSVNISFFYSDSFEFGDKNKASDDYAYDATGVKLRVRHVSPISAMASDVTFHMDRFDTALQSIASLIEVEEAPSVRASLTDLMQGLAVSNNMTIASDISGTSKTSSKTTTKSSTSSTLPKVQVSPASELSEHDEHVTDYCGNLIYEDGVLNKILFDGGCITFEDGSPVYHVYFRDHLGSVRVVCDRNGNAEQVNHYYPYGGLIGDLSTDDNKQKYRYKYNGKEFDRMHGLDTYDYGARQYNPARITWDRMDQYAEKYYHINPYVYCAGNPVNAIDPDGKEWTYAKDSNGNISINVALNFSITGNWTTEQINEYKHAISSQFNNMLFEASSGIVSGTITFYDGNPSIVQKLSLDEYSDNKFGGLTDHFSSSVNLYNKNGIVRDLHSVASDAIHEMLHTLRLGHPFEITQTEDTELIRIDSENFASTLSTDNNIVNNIMSYPMICVDGKRGNNQTHLTKGQLYFMLEQIELQNRGYGFFNYNKALSNAQNTNIYNEYYGNYWNNWPGIPVKNQ